MVSSGWPMRALAAPYRDAVDVVLRYVRRLSLRSRMPCSGGTSRFYKLWAWRPVAQCSQLQRLARMDAVRTALRLSRCSIHFYEPRVSGFEGGRTALHWHRKLQLWLPPGGHIDPNEDMAQAVVREVLEETGIAARIVPHVQAPPFTNLPQLPVPLAIIVADVAEGRTSTST